MGKKIAVEHNNRKKKKGRPSLLDVQKRYLRLQKEKEGEDEELQRNPNPNSKHRIDENRRGTKRNNPDDDELGGEGVDDDEEDDVGKRREKKLKFVHRLASNGMPNQTELDSSGSDSEGRGNSRTKKNRKIESVVEDGSHTEVMVKLRLKDRFLCQKQFKHAKWLIWSPLCHCRTQSCCCLSLTDSKSIAWKYGISQLAVCLLFFFSIFVFHIVVYFRKDTYGVFSEPVDPEELPDYHDIIENPMDFSTIRNKLSNGAYANLEQFEEDVYLLTSNAMRYNSSDTIYFRQARSIQELAKKDFENLRQESDDNEPGHQPEPKIVKRGRPPNKNIFKKRVGRPSADHSKSNSYDFSTSTLTNSYDKTLPSNLLNYVSRKEPVMDKFSPTVSASQLIRNNERFGRTGNKKTEKNDEPTGYVLKGSSTKYGKKAVILEENRRNSYVHPQLISSSEPSILTTFDEERKQLIPIGLHMKYSYARSLARFASNLGPVGWEIAARQIQNALPPGTQFGRGWVCEKDAPQANQPPLPPMSSSQSPTTSIYHPPEIPVSSNVLTSGANLPSKTSVPILVAPVIPNSTLNPSDMVEISNTLKHGSYSGPPTGSGIRSNGFNSGFACGISEDGKTTRSPVSKGSLSPQVQVTHVRALDMVSKSDNSFKHPEMINHHADSLRAEAVNQVTMSAKINLCQTSSNLSDVDSKKLEISNFVNFANSSLCSPSVNDSSTKIMDTENAKINNSSTTANAVKTRLIQSTLKQPETKSERLSNPSTLDFSGASFTLSGTATCKSEPETLNKLVNPGTMSSKSESTQNPKGFWHGLPLHPKMDSAPPDLNVRFQSPGSPASGLMTDSQNPDLALQL